jgi:hypothetical protein
MARHLGRVAALAAVVVVGALALGQVVSGRGGDRAALAALFLAFLMGAFALLAAAVVDSEHGVEKISASPHWSLRAAIKRRVRRVLAFLGRFVRRVVAIIHDLIGRSARGSRAGVARLRESLTPERREEKWNALKQAGRATLVALGLPPDDEASELNEGLDAMPTLPRTRPRPPDLSRQPRRIDIGPLRKAFRPSAAGWRATRSRIATESRVRSSSGG